MTEQELKQRFFARYWGVKHECYGEIYENLNGVDIALHQDMIMILKNIENISDEDLKELGDILFKDVKKGYDDISYSKEVKEYVIYLNMHVSGIKQPVSAVVFSKDGFGLTSLVSDGGLDYKWFFCRYSYYAIDHLRSKGYLIPFMHLSIQDILDRGWAKYED
jgi:hypothetical protein